MKHKLVAILTSALIVTGILSAVAFTEEGQADEYTKLEGSGSGISQSNTSKGVNTGCIDGDRLETVEEQLEKLDSSDLTEEEREMVLRKLLDEGDEN